MGCFRANKCTAYGKSLDRLRFSIQMRIYSEDVCILQSFDNSRGIQQSILQGRTEVCLFSSARTSFGAFDSYHVPRQFFFSIIFPPFPSPYFFSSKLKFLPSPNIFHLYLLIFSSPPPKNIFFFQIISSFSFSSAGQIFSFPRYFPPFPSPPQKRNPSPNNFFLFQFCLQ